MTAITANPKIVAFGVRKVSGVVVDNAGVSGRTSTNWNTTLSYELKSAYASTVPDLAFIALYTNDANIGVSPATYKANVKSLATQLLLTSDVVLVANVPASGLNLVPFRQALFELADELNVPLIDMYGKWGTYSAANALGLMADIFHPGNAGYWKYARDIIPILR